MSNMEPRALIVEDDPSWQQILTEICRDEGLKVDRAESLEGAIRLIRSIPHRIAVLDLSLGGTDHHNQEGLLVLDAVRRHDPTCASIILTGFATVELAVSVIQEKGAFTCLQKDAFRRTDFRKLIGEALAAVPPPASPAREPTSSGSESPLALDSPGAPERSTRFVERALVVEDDAGWRSLLTELLREAEIQARPCVSYVEALGLLRSEAFQLVVVDLSLASSVVPGTNQDGYRLLAHTLRSGIPTVIVSGYADPADIERAYSEYQLFACLEKQDFNRKHFVETARKARQAWQMGSDLRHLTGREREVLTLLAQGYKNKEIAGTLCIAPDTVKRHLKSLFAKLGVKTRSAASVIAARAGLVTPQKPDGQ